jgi:hypothetical protein
LKIEGEVNIFGLARKAAILGSALLEVELNIIFRAWVERRRWKYGAYS